MTKYWALFLIKEEEIVWEGWQLNKSFKYSGINEPVSKEAEEWDGRSNTSGTYYVVELKDD